MTAPRRKVAYSQKVDGEVNIANADGEIKIECCDCGLVHHLVFAVVRHNRKNRVAFAAWRDERATAQRRRMRRKK
jgi:nitrate/TMAO reductase-like tetraheme cytochrome c subunit